MGQREISTAGARRRRGNSFRATAPTTVVLIAGVWLNACAIGPQAVMPPATPLPPLDPNAVHAELQPVRFEPQPNGQGLLVIAYTVRNDNDRPIYLLADPAMPYVQITGPDRIELGFSAAIEPDTLSIGVFVPLKLARVGARAVYRKELRITYPFREHDYMYLPGSPTRLGATVTLRATQGYGETLFDFKAPDNDILSQFMRWQKTLLSNEVTISGLN